MLKKLYMYGLDDPYWFTISIISAIIIAAVDFKKLWWLVIIFIIIAILTVFKTIRKYQIINSLLTDHALLSVESALDLSAGTGYSTIRMAKATLNANVIGIEDTHQISINRALNNVYKRKVNKRVSIIKRDITKLEFPDDSFEVITGNYSNHTQLFIRNRKRRQVICNEIARLVKKDGTGTILMVNTKRQIQKMAMLFNNMPGFQVYIADPQLHFKFGYAAMKIDVKK